MGVCVASTLTGHRRCPGRMTIAIAEAVAVAVAVAMAMAPIRW